MGTHQKGPCTVYGTAGKISLAEKLQSRPEALGDKLKTAIYKENSESGVQLPFLFKVLSVNKALSIQSHPTKVTRFWLALMMKFPLLGRVEIFETPDGV